MKSRNCKFLEFSGSLQACNGTALPFILLYFLILFQESMYWRINDMFRILIWEKEDLIWTRRKSNINYLCCSSHTVRLKHIKENKTSDHWDMRNMQIILVRKPQWVKRLEKCKHKIDITLYMYGHGSSVGIATELRAGRSGIESRWERDFTPVQTGPGAHPASCKMGTGSLPEVKCGRGVLLTTHPLLVPRSCKSRAIPLSTLWTTPGL